MVVAEIGAKVLGVDGADGDHVPVGCGIGGDSAPLVAGRRHHQAAHLRYRVDDLLFRLRSSRPPPAAVDDLRPHAPGVQDRLVRIDQFGIDYRGVGRHFQRHDPCAEPDPGHPLAVVAGCGRNARNVNAVRVGCGRGVVPRSPFVPGKVVAPPVVGKAVAVVVQAVCAAVPSERVAAVFAGVPPDRVDQIGMKGIDSGVDHGNYHRCGGAGQFPRSGKMKLFKVGLLVQKVVVRQNGEPALPHGLGVFYFGDRSRQIGKGGHVLVLPEPYQHDAAQSAERRVAIDRFGKGTTQQGVPPVRQQFRANPRKDFPNGSVRKIPLQHGADVPLGKGVAYPHLYPKKPRNGLLRRDGSRLCVQVHGQQRQNDQPGKLWRNSHADTRRITWVVSPVLRTRMGGWTVPGGGTGSR